MRLFTPPAQLERQLEIPTHWQAITPERHRVLCKVVLPYSSIPPGLYTGEEKSSGQGEEEGT